MSKDEHESVLWGIHPFKMRALVIIPQGATWKGFNNIIICVSFLQLETLTFSVNLIEEKRLM